MNRSAWVTVQEDEQYQKPSLYIWALKCQGANVFTVHASGLSSDFGIM